MRKALLATILLPAVSNIAAYGVTEQALVAGNETRSRKIVLAR